MGRRPLLQNQGEDVRRPGIGPGAVYFQVPPETFAELIERQNIRPSPYLARYKWVMLDRLDALRNDELRDLIRLSYEMVAAKAHGDARTTSRNARKSAAKRPAVRLRSGRVSRARGKRTRS